MTNWPFSDPQNVAVFTSRRIVDGRDWIHHVAHDEDDGAWQFHPFSGPATEEDGCVSSLLSIVEMDGAITALSDLPVGWHAWRDKKDGPWHRAKKS